MIYEKKEFRFRGKTLEELKQLDIREFAKHIDSRARRSILRNFNVIEKFVKLCAKKTGKIRTHQRDLIVVPAMVGLEIFIYNGKEFTKVVVVSEMLGHRLGEFAPTRRVVKHGAPGVGATKSSSSMSVK